MSVNIKAQGSVYAKYCQYAEIHCNNLRVENQMMHSIIHVEQRLWLGTDDKANGKLIAGFISAGTSVHAGIVGATAGSTTIIQFTEHLANLNEKLAKIDVLVDAESKKTNELKAGIDKLKKLPKDKLNPDMLNKLVSTYKHHANKMGEYLSNKEQQEEEINQYMSSVFVEATEKLYHGVQTIVGDFQERTKREYGPSRIRYKERKVFIDPIVSG